MPDIELRLGKDMLVISAPLDATLARQGIDAARDRQYLNLMEPDVVGDAMHLELVAGAACLATATEDITAARLAHVRMEGDAARLAAAALDVANGQSPQHVLVEIGPCGLPLDAASKASLNENRAQYAGAARAFAGGQFDAFLLSGFSDVADLKCALMGVAQVSDKPVFASVTVGRRPVTPPDEAKGRQADAQVLGELDEQLLAGGYELMEDPTSPPLPAAYRRALDPAELPGVFTAMAELGASVIGFETADPTGKAVEYAKIAAGFGLPVLAQLHVMPAEGDPKVRALTPVEDIDDYTPETIGHAAVKLYAAGVQFLRATGAATSSFTGALAATVQGLDVLSR